jgi:RNA polymerase subunit RPABC4/transcription elongation factor Spt4
MKENLCLACEHVFYGDLDHCPECGSEHLDVQDYEPLIDEEVADVP